MLDDLIEQTIKNVDAEFCSKLILLIIDILVKYYSKIKDINLKLLDELNIFLRTFLKYFQKLFKLAI